MRLSEWVVLVVAACLPVAFGVATSPASSLPRATSNGVAVSVGGEAGCALTSTGGVKCWGARVYRGTSYLFTTPDWVPGVTSGVKAISTGDDHSCALTTVGGVKCWGENDVGQLGDGTTKDRSSAVDVVDLSTGVTALSSRGDHSCAVLAGGGVRCWGGNDYGELGDGTTRNRHVPVAVVGLAAGAAAISSGWSATCAVLVDGQVECWGENDRGQLGDGTMTDRLTPTIVAGLPGRAASVAIGSDHACALVPGQGLFCWGGNRLGQIGDGTTHRRRAPVSVVGMDGEPAVVVTGDHYSCAVTADNHAECWGANARGQLGDGTRVNRWTPTPALRLGHDVTGLAAGGEHTCAVTGAGAVRCWGDNSGGQIGDGTLENSRSVPMTVWGFPGARAHTFQPDLLVSRHRNGHYLGNDVYTATGSAQTVEFKAVSSRIVTFHLILQADGDVGDIVYVEGNTWNRWQYPIIKTQYFRGGKDITREIELGYYWTRVGVDGQVRIRVKVEAQPTLVPRKGAWFTVSSLSSHDPRTVDAVRIKAVRPE